jgi:hypothetical protein
MTRKLAVSFLFLLLVEPCQEAQVGSDSSPDIASWSCAKGYFSRKGHSSEAVFLTSSEILKRVVRSTPLEPPCCSLGLSIKGEVEVDVLINPKGRVVCSQAVTGNALALSSAITSLPKWRFRPYDIEGRQRDVIGRLALPYDFRGK